MNRFYRKHAHLKRLFDSINSLAEQHTNAVQLIICNESVLHEETRYPEQGVGFAGNTWRVFYHCHASPVRQPEEHGHFHFFTRAANDQWAHVVALSVDEFGQPLKWLVTNRWVTDGPWLTLSNLIERLGRLETDREQGVLRYWCSAMLSAYANELLDLYRLRDQTVRLLRQQNKLDDVLESHKYYLLASLPINVAHKLSGLRQRVRPPVARPIQNPAQLNQMVSWMGKEAR